ncbi:cation:proton antiporter [Pseudomonas aeruginosa]|nr:cation:proton antiporter [Pseudomonas aeruginosa]
MVAGPHPRLDDLPGWDDPATHVVLMLLLPFASYMVAEHLGVSGILSAVAAGMMQSWVDLLPRQTSTRLLNRSVWSMLEFAFNGVVFLLLGLQLPDIMKSVANHHGDLLWRSSLLLAYVAAITAVLMLIRYGWVYGYWKLSLRIDRWRGKSPPGLSGISLRRLSALSALSGVRGAVTLAAVLSVPMSLMDGSAFLAARPDHLHRHQRDPDFPDRRDHRPAAAAARAAGEQQWRPRARAARGLAQDRGGGDPGPGERGTAAGGRQRCGEYFAGRRGACADHG